MRSLPWQAATSASGKAIGQPLCTDERRRGKGLAPGPESLAKVTQGLGATIGQLGEIGDSACSVMGKRVRDDGHGGRRLG
ncbi:hypothetical protein [Streptomyces sp. NPDC058545]|uniref:hypothetical protein n=1 Tax=Streptomyces sp. NPDC058545 TaxID=3346544 RepID=UPI00365B29D3